MNQLLLPLILPAILRGGEHCEPLDPTWKHEVQRSRMTCLGHTAHRRKWRKTDCTSKAQTLLIHFPGETTSADSVNLPRYLRPAGRIHPSSLETTASTRPQFGHTAWLLPQPEHGRPQYPLTAVTRRLLQGRVGGWTARGPGWPKDTAGHRSGAQHQLTLPSSRHTLSKGSSPRASISNPRRC